MGRDVGIPQQFARCAVGVAVYFCLVVGCGQQDEGFPDANTSVLRLATTTSTRDSGLLDELLPDFERQHGCRVDVIAVGTGAALKLGEAGDVDALLVHARQAEEAFMQQEHGIRHEELMSNEFLILGPDADPADIRNVKPVESLQRIAAGKQTFVSRGDNSGTHRRESSLWETAGGRPDWSEYLESGQGMGPTLMMADEKQGYVLSDFATYLNFRDKISLVPLAAPHGCMKNPYAAIVVNPAKHAHVNSQLAEEWVDYLVSAETQDRIGRYQIAGEQLFRPTRLSTSK